jgi:hypothetical protein
MSQVYQRFCARGGLFPAGVFNLLCKGRPETPV